MMKKREVLRFDGLRAIASGIVSAVAMRRWDIPISVIWPLGLAVALLAGSPALRKEVTDEVRSWQRDDHPPHSGALALASATALTAVAVFMGGVNPLYALGIFGGTFVVLRSRPVEAVLYRRGTHRKKLGIPKRSKAQTKPQTTPAHSPNSVVIRTKNGDTVCATGRPHAVQIHRGGRVTRYGGACPIHTGFQLYEVS